MRGKILDYTTQIESLLTKLGATGRGMHEKLDSIESNIEAPMVKKIRWIATLRNKAVHEENFNTDINNFIAGANEVIRYLQALLNKQHAENKKSTSESDSNKNWKDKSGWEKAASIGLGVAALAATAVALIVSQN
ncbi:hypothetical protein OQH45_15600 [Acinetobacter baumannii]|uniref:hypothetical protein n=1 Tax=Acinetobacter baumannii TaxID=470 RepID=UPI0022446C1A|nr:hypothetical protein [Acinetobacter baumannii]MCW8692330.1 hypothetical protein [Acinetobacter baumannii]MCW8769129.1 hypothetical protein [Acinetobacter baumannii]